MVTDLNSKSREKILFVFVFLLLVSSLCLDVVDRGVKVSFRWFFGVFLDCEVAIVFEMIRFLCEGMREPRVSKVFGCFEG